jgi:hypothetical protein
MAGVTEELWARLLPSLPMWCIVPKWELLHSRSLYYRNMELLLQSIVRREIWHGPLLQDPVLLQCTVRVLEVRHSPK